MEKYRVRPGMRHGANKEHGPGDIVELTKEEASGFLDKLELVVEEETQVKVADPETELDDFFPALLSLNAAGYTTYQQVNAVRDNLTDIDEIGPVTASKIITELDKFFEG